MDRVLDKLNWLFNFHLNLWLLLNFWLNFRLFLLLLLYFAGVEIVTPFMSFFLQLFLDDLAFFSELLVALAIEESLHDIDSLVKKFIQGW